MRQRSILVLSLALLIALAGCGAGGGAGGSSTSPTAVLSSQQPDAAQSPSVPSDDIAFVRHNHVWRVHADGTEPEQMSRGAGVDFSPAWSPDRTHVAYIHTPGTGPQGDSVCEVPASGGQATTWRFDHTLLSLCYSPDGSRIALATRATTDEPLAHVSVLSRATGTTTVVCRLHDPFIEGMTVSWSPDGARLLLGKSRTDADGQRSGILTLASGRVVWLPTRDACAARWSPDGRSIVVDQSTQDYTAVSIADIRGRIRRTLLRGGGWVVTPPPVFGGCYSPSGARIAYSYGKAIWTISIDGGHKRRVVALGSQPAWSAR